MVHKMHPYNSRTVLELECIFWLNRRGLTHIATAGVTRYWHQFNLKSPAHCRYSWVFYLRCNCISRRYRVCRSVVPFGGTVGGWDVPFYQWDRHYNTIKSSSGISKIIIIQLTQQHNETRALDSFTEPLIQEALLVFLQF